MAGKRVVWHYTNMDSLEKIVECGWLLTESETTPQALRPGEKGFLWFSEEEFWEPTVCVAIEEPETGKTVRIPTERIHEKDGGLVRIGAYLDRGFIPWAALRSKMKKETYNSLQRTALKEGANPNKWYAREKPLQLTKCFVVEEMQGGKWVSIFVKEK